MDDRTADRRRRAAARADLPGRVTTLEDASDPPEAPDTVSGRLALLYELSMRQAALAGWPLTPPPRAEWPGRVIRHGEEP